MNPRLALRRARQRKIVKAKRAERIALNRVFLDISSRNLMHTRMWCRDNPDLIAGAEAQVMEDARMLAMEMQS